MLFAILLAVQAPRDGVNAFDEPRFADIVGLMR
jgi:hypothetical protein